MNILKERIPNVIFNIMCIVLKLQDKLFPVADKIKSLGLQEGSTVIDYGCGPGNYLKTASLLIGPKGKLYAIDVHELAMKAIREKIEKNNLTNVEPVCVSDYSVALESNIADLIYAIDMFHMINEPQRLLQEWHRLVKQDGMIIIDYGRFSKNRTITEVKKSNLWKIEMQSKSDVKCTPIQ